MTSIQEKEKFSEPLLLLHEDGDIMNETITELNKSFSQILENPNEDDLNQWLEDNLTEDISAISAICLTLNDSFFGPLSPFSESKFNTDDNFQVLLSVQEHINQHFPKEVEQAIYGNEPQLLKFMHSVTILWKTALHGPSETPKFPPNIIKDKLSSINDVEEEVLAFLLDRLIVNILWPVHRGQIDNLSIEEIEEFLHSFTVQNFANQSLNYYAKTYYFHYFKEGDERVVGLRDTPANNEFSNGFTNYLIASRLHLENQERTPMLLSALNSFIETNDHQRQSAILTRLMKAGVDTLGDDGSYTQTFSEDGVIKRIESILNILNSDQYPQKVVHSVVNEIVEYMMYRVRKNNQQSMSNHFHAGYKRVQIDDLDRLDELHVVTERYDRIIEIVGILQLIRDGKTGIKSEENPLLERWLDEIENPERVLTVYSLEDCDVSEIIYAGFGCLLHSASNHLSESSARTIISELQIQLNTRKDASTDVSMKHFIDQILEVINYVTNFEKLNWREKLNQRLKSDLDKFILERNITTEQVVYSFELHRSMMMNRELHPNYEEDFYEIILFIEHIIDEFDNNIQCPVELMNPFHSIRMALHNGLTGYIEEITPDDETRAKHEETFGFTIERLEEIQAKLLPKEE